MITKFLRITFLAVLCLSLAGKVLLHDACDDSKLVEKNKSVVVYNSSADSSHSVVGQNCACHCHHNHFDFAFIENSSIASSIKSQDFVFDSTSALPPQINSLQRPPKIVS